MTSLANKFSLQKKKKKTCLETFLDVIFFVCKPILNFAVHYRTQGMLYHDKIAFV